MSHANVALPSVAEVSKNAQELRSGVLLWLEDMFPLEECFNFTENDYSDLMKGVLAQEHQDCTILALKPFNKWI